MPTLTCAIQFGSNRIMAIAAMKDMKTGSLSNIQIESESARDCISYGYVNNVEKTAMHIRSIIQKLGNRMRATITSAHVGAGGLSLHSLIQQPTVQIPDYDVLDSSPLDEGQYQLIVGQKRIRQRIQAAMDRAGIHLCGFVALPKATACILTPDMRQRGCVLVDMGAATTTVSIYHQGQLRHLAVIPMGGDNVTIDIQSSGCSFDEAERNKTDWSNVSQETPTDADSSNASFADKTLSMPLSKLNTIALCRYEEIAANILHQIEISGLQKQLEAGCILTGGAAQQNGLASLLRRRLNVARIEVRAYREAAMLNSERKPHLTNALALLNFCTEDCQAPLKPATPAAHNAPGSSTATNQSSVTQKPSDGQLNLDLPDDPEPETPQPSKEQSHPVRGIVSRFLRDLITGQDDTPTQQKRK